MFLTGYELQLMKQDFRNLLASYEASNVVIRYTELSGLISDKDAYGNREAESKEIVIIQTKAIHKIVKNTDIALLRWGAIEVGESIFYFSSSLDLSGTNKDDTVFIAGGVTWRPKQVTNQSFSEFIAVNIGNEQFAQAIVATKAN